MNVIKCDVPGELVPGICHFNAGRVLKAIDVNTINGNVRSIVHKDGTFKITQAFFGARQSHRAILISIGIKAETVADGIHTRSSNNVLSRR